MRNFDDRQRRQGTQAPGDKRLGTQISSKCRNALCHVCGKVFGDSPGEIPDVVTAGHGNRVDEAIRPADETFDAVWRRVENAEGLPAFDRQRLIHAWSRLGADLVDVDNRVRDLHRRQGCDGAARRGANPGRRRDVAIDVYADVRRLPVRWSEPEGPASRLPPGGAASRLRASSS